MPTPKTTESPSPEDGKSLPELRAEIRELTKSILALVEARQTVSLQIAEIKNRSEEKIENIQVEEQLVASMADYSQRIGLDSELGRKIVGLLIEASKVAQTESTFRKRIQIFLESKKIARISIVGAGRMGTWFAKYFQQLAVPVMIYDEDHERAKSKAKEHSLQYAKSLDQVVSSDLIVVAVPIAKTPKTIKELAKIATSSKKIKILEISSIKNEIAKSGLFSESKSLQENIELYSIHPLFGAAAKIYVRNTILQVDPGDMEFLKGLFPHYYLEPLDWKAHDELMALLLTIPHSLALVFANLLSTKKQLRSFKMKAPSFEHMLSLSQRVLGENPEVYFEIEASNPNTDRALKDLLASVNKLRKSLESKDDFLKFFSAAKRAAEEKVS
jgi:prephenate dehydrogenase/chorismate mutase